MSRNAMRTYHGLIQPLCFSFWSSEHGCRRWVLTMGLSWDFNLDKFEYHWIGLREHLQETPIFNGKKTWFPVYFPLNQSNSIVILACFTNYDSTGRNGFLWVFYNNPHMGKWSSLTWNKTIEACFPESESSDSSEQKQWGHLWWDLHGKIRGKIREAKFIH